MITLSHPTGNANVRNALISLHGHHLLHSFITTLNWDTDSMMHTILPQTLTSKLARRSYPREIRSLIRAYPLKEVLRLLLPQNTLPNFLAKTFSIDSIYTSIDAITVKELEKQKDIQGVYAYEDGAYNSFLKANQLNIKAFYDLPIGYWRAGLKIQEEEQQLEPEWSSTLTILKDSQFKQERKDQELKNATSIFVASTFVRKTLEEAPFITAPIHIIPYGCPSPSKFTRSIDKGKEKLRVLYVGSLSQRKGLAYLLKAIHKNPTVANLTLIGSKISTCPVLDKSLQKHRWIPSLPHHKILEEMRQHDVLVFPSLFEGFGLVITEALSQGLPVITTPNTAGPDLLTDGIDGFIIPIRSSEAIAEKLELLATDKERLSSMKEAAHKKASQLTWEKYQDRLAERIINSFS